MESSLKSSDAAAEHPSVEEISKDESPTSPPPPEPSPEPEKAVQKVESLKRRSSVGRSIRRSQSTANNGLTFEDQLMVLVGNDSMSVEERIAKMVNLSVSATCRTLLRENDRLVDLQPGSRDDLQAELTDNLASSLPKKELLRQTDVAAMSGFVKRLKAAKAKGQQQGSSKATSSAMVSSRLRRLQEYVSTLKREKEGWDDLFKSRKEKYYSVRSERTAVVKGENCVSAEDRWRLSEQDDAWLRSISDGSEELEVLKRQADDLDIAQRKLNDDVARSRKMLEDKNAELDSMIKRIEANSKRVILGDNAEPLLSALTKPPSSQAPSRHETEFGAEVKAWMADNCTS